MIRSELFLRRGGFAHHRPCGALKDNRLRHRRGNDHGNDWSVARALAWPVIERREIEEPNEELGRRYRRRERAGERETE